MTPSTLRRWKRSNSKISLPGSTQMWKAASLCDQQGWKRKGLQEAQGQDVFFGGLHSSQEWWTAIVKEKTPGFWWIRRGNWGGDRCIGHQGWRKKLRSKEKKFFSKLFVNIIVAGTKTNLFWLRTRILWIGGKKKGQNLTLVGLARKHPCMPVTSTMAEKVFSWQGHLLNKRRLNLSGESVTMRCNAAFSDGLPHE